MNTQDGYRRILDARYKMFGVNATIVNPVTRATASLRMIDLTKGVTTGQDFAQVSTVEPIATARSTDLTALRIEAADMVGEKITLNSVDWVVASYAPHPGPFGPDLSQVYFTLEEPVE